MDQSAGSPSERVAQWSGGQGPDNQQDCAGDPPCLAAQVCPSCGGVLAEGHQPGCALADLSAD